MGTISKTVTVTDQQDIWIRARIAKGLYTNESEYFRDLIRRDQRLDANARILESTMQAELGGELSQRLVDEAWAEMESGGES